MTAAIKEEKPKTTDVLVAERKKEAIEVIAPKIVNMVSTLGVRTPFGFKMVRDAAAFEHNELTGVVSAHMGANEMFLVNLPLKRCTLYRKGSWFSIYLRLQEEFKARDNDETRQTHQQKFRELYGID